MKIVHLCLSNFYIDNFGYQENIIPKYNKKEGHDVTIIASRFSYNIKNGENTKVQAGSYFTSYGIKVIRIDYKYKWLGKINDKIKIYKETYKLLEKEKPDIIFNHGMQFLDLLEVARYIKDNPECLLYVDNHAANINSGTNILSRQILHKKMYKWVINKSLPYIKKIFAIAPGCKEFAKEMYGIPDEKIEYLFLGADTDKINLINKAHARKKIREELNIDDKDFLFITGGKLSKGKNISQLLEAFRKIDNKDIKIIIFGVFSDDIKKELLTKIESDNRIIYIGWLKGEDVYSYYLASDAAIFPGTKSALWEQAICCGLPLICKKWTGMEYVDVGGNCIFLDNDEENSIIESIKQLHGNPKMYKEMKKVAETTGYNTFSYEKISRQAIFVE
ncbi:glycosyltransferase family 4 protein [Metabacillus sp. GX 13764]|uniref:glycosyltransferase family 4 protein n=1 Tax=Metabacillus kandeliae TaxID=2900151 RepID=UPI001E4038AB|nr:glycosyltransferase family 4 protein [Metabacillus kandeliae]MCD7034583.1 glycosyltransferase family 4 protein [Metabacillus kandeliae]